MASLLGTRRTSAPRASVVAMALTVCAATPGRVATAEPPPAPTGSSSHTPADIAQARDLFNQALALRSAGDLPGALEKFKAAHALGGTPITGLELARTMMQLGSLVAAREMLLSIARIPVTPQETGRSSAARSEAAQLAEGLRARIPLLTVKVTGAPPESISLTIDGAALPAASLDAPRPVDPGSHQLVASSSSGGRAETSVKVREGEAQTVELALSGGPDASTSASTSAEAPSASVWPSATASATAPSSASPSSSPTAAEQGRPLGLLVYAGFGAGALGVAVGSVSGIFAFAKASTVKDTCHQTTTCPTSVDSDLQSGRLAGNVSTVAFIVAGVGLAAGAIGLFLRSAGDARAGTAGAITCHPWIGSGAAGLEGAF